MDDRCSYSLRGGLRQGGLRWYGLQCLQRRAGDACLPLLLLPRSYVGRQRLGTPGLATPLGQIAAAKDALPDIHNTLGGALTDWDAFLGFLPGSVGEVSTLAILIGALILIFTGIASYKIMVSGVVGVFAMASLFNAIGATPAMQVSALHHLLYGGFAFGIVFMATDPVTAARTEAGKWVYGFLVGVMVVFIRVLNAGYAEGMMLAILLMNTFAPLIDYIVVERNVNKRKARLAVAKN